MGILGKLKFAATRQAELLYKKATGMEYPEKDETLAYLQDYLITPGNDYSIELPEVTNVADKNKIIFSESLMHGSRNYIWDYKAGEKKSNILRIGSVVTDNKVLQTDFGYPRLFTDDFGGKHVFRDLATPDKRQGLHAGTLIAPWSHYIRKEYFMFVMFVAAKLCRIKDSITEELFNEAIVSYPLFYTTFEPEYLDLIGIKPEKIVDSRLTKITFDRCILGNNDNWVYPNASDVFALKKHVEPKLEITNIGAEGNKRIYICRSGRRQVVNERALIKMLTKFDFVIYEDQTRTVAEQYAMYHNASFIMGPHGSSFTNIVWCKPGAHLFELFPPRYVYNFFHYLAEMLGLNYSAYCNGPIAYDYRNKTINDDITVSIAEIEEYLEGYFGGG